MNTRDKITLNAILQHKEHFDNRLIDINQNLLNKNDSLSTENKQLKQLVRDNKQSLSQMKFKVKDLEIQKYNIEQKYSDVKKENEDLLKIIENLENELSEIIKNNEDMQRKIDEALKENKKIIKENKKIIKEYETKLNKYEHSNSSNSNMPSSFDVLGRTKAKAMANTRVKTGRKRGGQNNHPLHKSGLSKKVDYIKEMIVKEAPKAAIPVKDKDGKIKYYATQEVDLILKNSIIETRYYIDENGEDLKKEMADKYKINPLTYSGYFKAVTVYLNQKGTIPLQRLCDMMQEISKGSIQLRAGTIVKWCEECYKKSELAIQEILEDMLKEAVVHVDETGSKVSGTQHWIHVITNDKGSMYMMSKQRGDKEKGAVKKLKTYEGTLVHDHFATYQSLTNCKHAECNAHIERYLKSGIDFDKSEDCKEMLELLHEMLHSKKELMEQGKGSMTEEEIRSYESKYLEILNRGLDKYYKENPDIKKKYEPDYIKAFKRMIIFEEDHLRFIKDFVVPYTNNAAERQCRAVKAKKKTSGQFVTERGGQTYVRILSLLQTAKIRNENALETIEKLFL